MGRFTTGSFCKPVRPMKSALSESHNSVSKPNARSRVGPQGQSAQRGYREEQQASCKEKQSADGVRREQESPRRDSKAPTGLERLVPDIERRFVQPALADGATVTVPFLLPKYQPDQRQKRSRVAILHADQYSQQLGRDQQPGLDIANWGAKRRSLLHAPSLRPRTRSWMVGTETLTGKAN